MDRRSARSERDKDRVGIIPESSEEPSVPSFNLVVPPTRETTQEQERKAGVFTILLFFRFCFFFLIFCVIFVLCKVFNQAKPGDWSILNVVSQPRTFVLIYLVMSFWLLFPHLEKFVAFKNKILLLGPQGNLIFLLNEWIRCHFLKIFTLTCVNLHKKKVVFMFLETLLNNKRKFFR